VRLRDGLRVAGVALVVVFVAGAVWHIVDLAQTRNARVEAARAANDALRSCLDRNMATDIGAESWRAIQRACELTVSGPPNPAAECVLRSRDAVLDDDTVQEALQACAFRPE
jgi:hypothetical protein